MVILAVGSLWYIIADHKQNGQSVIKTLAVADDISSLEDEQNTDR